MNTTGAIQFTGGTGQTGVEQTDNVGRYVDAMQLRMNRRAHSETVRQRCLLAYETILLLIHLHYYIFTSLLLLPLPINPSLLLALSLPPSLLPSKYIMLPAPLAKMSNDQSRINSLDNVKEKFKKGKEDMYLR